MTKEIAVLKPFDVVKEELTTLANDYAGLVVTKETFENAKKARAVLREKRFLIQNIEKENNDKINLLKKDNKTNAAELIALIEPTELKIDAGIKQIENEKEIARKEKALAEQAAIQSRIQSLFNLGMQFNGLAYVIGDVKINSLEVKEFDQEKFDLILSQAQVEHTKITEAKAEEERKQAEEKARLDEVAKEQAAEALRLEKLKKEQEEEIADLKAKAEKREKEINEGLEKISKQQAERKAEMDKQAEDLKEAERKLEQDKKDAEAEKQKAIEIEEAKKVAAEKALADAEAKRISEENAKKIAETAAKLEAERQLSLRPDKEKLEEYAANIRSLRSPVLENKEAGNLVITTSNMLNEVADALIKGIEKL